MGVDLRGVFPSKEIEINDLAGKRIAIDSYNMLYQFLSIIRDRFTGEPLRDHSGAVTSHLSGLLYRTVRFMEAGIKPIFIFDGKPPEFKFITIREREGVREAARKKWEQAVKEGKEAIKYAQAASKLTKDMVNEAKELLDCMGVPWIQAPSEGEAQCAFMCRQKDADFAASQDYDSLMFGAPLLVRNLSITGKRKVPSKEIYTEIRPEVIELEEVLKSAGIDHKQLIIIGLLVGTDYNKGVKGVGPKTALKLVKENKTLDAVLGKVKWEEETDAKDLFEFFLNPPAEEKYDIEWKAPDAERLVKFMVERHDFAADRMEKVAEKLQQSFGSSRQSNLHGWFKK